MNAIARQVAVVAIAAVCIIPSPSAAQQGLTGKQLVRACDQADKVFSSASSVGGQDLTEAHRCLAFVSGVMQGMTLGNTRASSSAKMVCLPARVPDVQIMRVTLAWLKKNPQRLNEPAGVLTAVAIRDTFPCL